MNSKEYVEKALRTNVTNPGAIICRVADANNLQLLHAVIGLCTETGELQDAIKKHLMYGKPLDRTNLIEEMGDVFWYLAILADYLQVDFETVMATNIAKLLARYPDKFTEDKALNRDLKQERRILDHSNNDD